MGVLKGWDSRAACPSCVSDTALSFWKPRGGCCSVNLKALSCPAFQMHCSLNPHVQSPGAVLSPSQQPHAQQKTRFKPGVMASEAP